MKKLNIHEAKTHLSRYLQELVAGETIVLCRRNVPIAEIRLLPKDSEQSLATEHGEEFAMAEASQAYLTKSASGAMPRPSVGTVTSAPVHFDEGAFAPLPDTELQDWGL